MYFKYLITLAIFNTLYYLWVQVDSVQNLSTGVLDMYIVIGQNLFYSERAYYMTCTVEFISCMNSEALNCWYTKCWTVNLLVVSLWDHSYLMYSHSLQFKTEQISSAEVLQASPHHWITVLKTARHLTRETFVSVCQSSVWFVCAFISEARRMVTSQPQ